MEKIIFILLATIFVASAQELSCNYFLLGATYRCDLTINNPDGVNNFTSIGGTHLDGLSDANVTYIVRAVGTTSILPTIICETFPNLEFLNFVASGVTELTDESLAGCTRLTWIRFWNSRISSISENAFANQRNLEYLDMDANQITSLPANVFANQQNLITLELTGNRGLQLPQTIFNSLSSLNILLLANTNLSTINPMWFANTPNLNYLYLADNNLSNLQDNWFLNLASLNFIHLGHNGISNIQNGALRSLTNLSTLYLYGNEFSEIGSGWFDGLNNLGFLDLGQSGVETIQNGAFRNLENLNGLSLSNNLIRNLSANAFEGLRNLRYLYIGNNRLEEFPEQVFGAIDVSYLGLWGNELKVLRRNQFGNLNNLNIMDLSTNLINGIDQRLLEDARQLDTLYLFSNLCENGWFGGFIQNRNQHMERLARCFRNFRYMIDIVTEANATFSFFEAPQPGISFRVNSNNEINIAITPFDQVWNPMVFIMIGTNNNTRSSITRNRADENPIVIPTPGILRENEWNDFRITWANHVLLVFREGDEFPFLAFTMIDIFPVRFYGLRSIQTTASWSVLPFDRR